MNKYFVFAVVICALALIDAKSTNKDDKDSKEISEKSDDTKDFKEIAQKINNKFNTTLFLDILKLADQVKEKCPHLENKMEKTIEEVGICVEGIEIGSDTFCSLIKKNYVKCSKPVRDLVISCLPTESKDLPVLSQKAILSIIETACSSTVEEILELFNPCALEQAPDSFDSCKEIKKTVDSYKNTLPSKSLVCSTLPKVRTCVKDMVVASCKNTITRNAHKKFYEGVDNALKDECDALNKA